MKALILTVVMLFVSSVESGILITEFIRHGPLDYMGINTTNPMTVAECKVACQEFSAVLVEPRNDDDEKFIKRHFPYTWINVFFGSIKTSSWKTWRYGSDGTPVRKFSWATERLSCAKIGMDAAVNMWETGWCGHDLRTTNGSCACQRKVRASNEMNNPL
ncbi:hypothetical protein HDE_07464 [Halotydeus destructor]|nr:hypothetical protein HDE_07464 [Halotydeus destructor]